MLSADEPGPWDLILCRNVTMYLQPDAASGLYRRLEEAVVPVHVNATSLKTGRGHWFTSGPAVDAILASAYSMRIGLLI